jgi:hypothetical protein
VLLLSYHISLLIFFTLLSKKTNKNLAIGKHNNITLAAALTLTQKNKIEISFFLGEGLY